MLDSASETITRDSIADIWGERTPYHGEWPARVDERTVEQPDGWVQSACVLCSNCCGLDIGVKDGRIVGVRGRESDRINQGRLGPKGLHGWEANSSAERLTRPLIREGAGFREGSWDEAMGLIVQHSQAIKERYTSHAMAFYLTGQLFLEEYYACSLIAKGGLGTPHIDGNTRLCTASAEAALRESFGSDGQPGSVRDIDTTDALFHIGHNLASQQTVVWARILDRRRGSNPPKMIVADPRLTETAREADLHLPLRAGTNLALMNGLLHLLIRHDYLDHSFIETHTVGFSELVQRAAKYTPSLVASITQLPEKSIEEAAEILGTTPSLCSTVLQGVYQSSQSVASAVQVNNLHLLRGLIGKPGSSAFQMNGQPTAQNTRECGCQGALPFFLNKDNPEHVQQAAARMNVNPQMLAPWVNESHLMQVLRFAEEGSIRFLWIACTNPAVSLPELSRIRRILAKPDLFVVVQDAFLTETAQLANVVLPAAIWGEKTGTSTNFDRTVHVSCKAINPPGEARSDFDIFLDYARRMDFRDKDGGPLLKFTSPEEAFNSWKENSKGTVCDYSGLSYAKLTGGSGMQWPCNEENPNGVERLYTDGVFHTAADVCQAYGHDLLTGAALTPEEYRASDPAGRAIFKSADYDPTVELPDEEYPFLLTTGRVVYHFHTRTKTGHSRELQNAAPEPFVQISAEDAGPLRISDGDLVEVISRRSKVVVPARIADIKPRHLFMPFHYFSNGYGSHASPNELIGTQWDPVSKQPYFKNAAVRLDKAIQTVNGHPSRRVKIMIEKPPHSQQQIMTHLQQLHQLELSLASAWQQLAKRHQSNSETVEAGQRFSSWGSNHAMALAADIQKYGGTPASMGHKLSNELFEGVRFGSAGLIDDLQDVNTLLQRAHFSYLILGQAAKSLRDFDLSNRLDELEKGNHLQIAWCVTQAKSFATQVLVVPQ
ncbi:MAG: molybdopterin oxidoreductase family protein [Acidobacteriaceae bacterium]|nr:molybdopterin oxidoreductase family protein [Acidobacteriaceae bacterium]